MNQQKEKVLQQMRQKQSQSPAFLQMKLKITYEEALKLCQSFIRFVGEIK